MYAHSAAKPSPSSPPVSRSSDWRRRWPIRSLRPGSLSTLRGSVPERMLSCVPSQLRQAKPAFCRPASAQPAGAGPGTGPTH